MRSTVAGASAALALLALVLGHVRGRAIAADARQAAAGGGRSLLVLAAGLLTLGLLDVTAAVTA